jgi:hypothetical protein
VVKALRRDGFSELLLRGERGDREAELRRRTGIPLPVKLWTELGDLAQELGLSFLNSDGSCDLNVRATGWANDAVRVGVRHRNMTLHFPSN